MQRRRQFLVHSFLYYVCDNEIVSDTKFNVWTRELIQLQNDHPEVAERLPYHDICSRIGTDYSAEVMGLTKPDYPPEIVSAAFQLLVYLKKAKSFKALAKKYGYTLEKQHGGK